MPVYEFKCKACDKRYEFGKNDVTAFCCEQQLVRVWAPAGVQFKGSGFYKTDYRRSKDVNKS